MPNFRVSICVLVGQKIKQIRIKANMSQEKLALECGLHRAYIGQIERAENVIGIVNLQIIAKALSVKIQDLFK